MFCRIDMLYCESTTFSFIYILRTMEILYDKPEFSLILSFILALSLSRKYTGFKHQVTCDEPRTSITDACSYIFTKGYSLHTFHSKTSMDALWDTPKDMEDHVENYR